MEVFKDIIKDANHLLYDLLTLNNYMRDYNLRTRPHQHVYPIKTFMWTRIF